MEVGIFSDHASLGLVGMLTGVLSDPVAVETADPHVCTQEESRQCRNVTTSD